MMLALLFTAAAAGSPDKLPLLNLQTNFMVSPLGVDRLSSVHFSWELPAAPRPGLVQKSARLVVSEAGGADGSGKVVHDSGTVATSRPEIAADLGTLRSDTAYTWSVQVSAASAAGETSAAATAAVGSASFTTGLLEKADWVAEWIRGGTQCRTEFVVPAGMVVHRASLFVAACQYYTLALDGQPVGDQVLDGPWTSFYNNRSYTTHDIAPALLAPGPHALGLRIGEGFCTSAPQDMYDPSSERSGIVQLHVHSDDSEAGSPALIVATNNSWSCSGGPIVSDSTYYGETYDAREETPGWDAAGFKPTSSWLPAQTNFSVVAQVSAPDSA
jgi:alpha-L-rhamnosidase